MQVKKMNPTGQLTDEVLFVKDNPSIFVADNINVNLDCVNGTGSYHMPNGMFNMPQEGDIIKVNMKSGRKLLCVVTSFDQNHVSATGKLIPMCYEDYFEKYLKMATKNIAN